MTALNCGCARKTAQYLGEKKDRLKTMKEGRGVELALANSMTKRLMLLFALSAAAIGQDQAIDQAKKYVRTSGEANCRWWNTSSRRKDRLHDDGIL